MDSTHKHDWPWMFASVLFVAVILLGTRYTSGILESGFVFDEKYITVPIDDLIKQGWSVQTAIAFEETKGPAMIWPYAILGDLFGGSLNALRFVSLLSSIACMLVLSWIASRSGVQKRGHFAVAAGWLLLPYALVFSEIVMGEISFILLELLAVAVYVRYRDNYKLLAPLWFGLLVAIALHSRIHVVALIGAVCVCAFLRDGIKSWPWWVAGALAGLLRIPLWLHWGGLVSPKYQNLHSLGFRLESLSYLAAALAPFVGIFAITAWKEKSARRWILAAGGLGLVLVFLAMPNLHIPESIDYDSPNERFQGIVGTAVRVVTSDLVAQKLLLAFFAAVGLAGLVGLQRISRSSQEKLLPQLTFYTLAFGWGLYAFTQGFVFDRFLMVWAFLLPIVWWVQLSKRLFALQIAAMLFITVRLVMLWL